VLTARNQRVLVADPRSSHAKFTSSRDISVSFTESKKGGKRFFLLSDGKPRTVKLKKQSDIAKKKVAIIDIKPSSKEAFEHSSSEETPEFKVKEEVNSTTDCYTDHIQNEKVARPSFTNAFNSIQTLKRIDGNNDNKQTPKANFRRRSRLLKANTKHPLPSREPTNTQPLFHKRLPITIQTERKHNFNPDDLPWNKDTDDPGNITFGED